MTLPVDIAEAIEKNAREGVASITVGNTTVVTKDVAQQIEADRYLAAQTAATRPHFGLRFTKLVPPGAG